VDQLQPEGRRDRQGTVAQPHITFLREIAIGLIIIAFLMFEPMGWRIAGGRSRLTGNSIRFHIEVGTERTTNWRQRITGGNEQ